MRFFPLHSGWDRHGHGGIVNNLVVNVSERDHYRHRYYDDNWHGLWRGPCNHWGGQYQGKGQGNGQINDGNRGGNGRD